MSKAFTVTVHEYEPAGSVPDRTRLMTSPAVPKYDAPAASDIDAWDLISTELSLIVTVEPLGVPAPTT